MRFSILCLALSSVAGCATANSQAVALIRARAAVDLSCPNGDADVTRRPGTLTYDVLACGKGASYTCVADPRPTGGRAASCELVHNP